MSISATTQKLTEITGEAPTQMTVLQGGCIGEVYQVTFSKHPPLAIKVAPSEKGKLDIEGFMLTYLHTNSPLPVPRVYYSASDLLVMDFLPGKSRFYKNAQVHAAELLAALHQIKAPQFGLERDTLIGGLHQPNSWTSGWLPFFREYRILHMARLAYQEGRLSVELLNRLEKFCERMPLWLSEPEHPSLLHGDAWTTNILAEGDKITGFLDPAIYYGHPEIELAFTTLFNTFDTHFFQRYSEISPIEPGFFELRKDLYNLYPLLVHVRLFGSSYAQPIEQTLKRLGC